jgi:hypothetical protein
MVDLRFFNSFMNAHLKYSSLNSRAYRRKYAIVISIFHMVTYEWSNPTTCLNPVELLKSSTDFLAKGIVSFFRFYGSKSKNTPLAAPMRTPSIGFLKYKR